ncbi:hypothetical protein AB0K15_13190 [Amycolatopsis sp. NPDC049253]|uniref:hypothetical protein n=1 Tax=Amycolatopsis sp. NPDC049253 TaxID=3155274 RepID=UPI003445CB12
MRGDVARFARATLGRSVPPERSVEIHAATAGVPRLAARRVEAANVDELVGGLRAELAALGESELAYLIAAGAGAGRDLELLAVAVQRPIADVSAVIARVRAAGMLAADDAVPPIVLRAVRDYVGPDRLGLVLLKMVKHGLAGGQPVLAPIRELLRLGATGVVVRAGLEAAAEEVLDDDPVLAADLYAAAVRDGAPRARLAPGWSRAAMLAQRFDVALQLGNELLSAADPAARTRGALVSGAIIAQRGDLARGGELLRWSAEPSAQPLADLAALALGESITPERESAPVSACGHLTGQMLKGITESLSARPEVGLATLLAAADSAGGTVLPDSAATLAALVALHSGEFDLARGV